MKISLTLIVSSFLGSTFAQNVCACELDQPALNHLTVAANGCFDSFRRLEELTIMEKPQYQTEAMPVFHAALDAARRLVRATKLLSCVPLEGADGVAFTMGWVLADLKSRLLLLQPPGPSAYLENSFYSMLAILYKSYSKSIAHLDRAYAASPSCFSCDSLHQINNAILGINAQVARRNLNHKTTISGLVLFDTCAAGILGSTPSLGVPASTEKYKPVHEYSTPPQHQEADQDQVQAVEAADVPVLNSDITEAMNGPVKDYEAERGEEQVQVLELAEIGAVDPLQNSPVSEHPKTGTDGSPLVPTSHQTKVDSLFVAPTPTVIYVDAIFPASSLQSPHQVGNDVTRKWPLPRNASAFAAVDSAQNFTNGSGSTPTHDHHIEPFEDFPDLSNYIWISQKNAIYTALLAAGVFLFI